MFKAFFREVKSDITKTFAWFALAVVSALAMLFVPWSSLGGVPGDLLSLIAFVLISLVILTHLLQRIAIPISLTEFAIIAKREPTGAAIVFASVVAFMSIILLSAVLLFSSPAQAGTYPADLPTNAYANLPIVMKAKSDYWPELSTPSVVAGQVEQESCITLKHSKCWSENAELKTDRERGVGLGQVTKTNSFDTMAEMKLRHKEALAGWSWESPYNATYQARALILHDKALFNSTRGAKTESDRFAMMLNCYNAGPGSLAKRKARCANTPGCDVGVWLGNLETAVGQSQAVAKGYGKSFQEIASEYPRKVFVRSQRYAFLDTGA